MHAGVPSLLSAQGPCPVEAVVLSPIPAMLEEQNWSREAFPHSASWHFLTMRAGATCTSTRFCLTSFTRPQEKENVIHAFQIPHS